MNLSKAKNQATSLLVNFLLTSLLISTSAFSVEVDLDTEEFAYLYANKKEIHDSISTFIVEGDIYTPVAQTLNALEVEYFQKDNSFTGWIFSPETTFSISDKENTFSEYNSLYFNLSDFCKTNGINITFNNDDGAIELTTSNHFSFEQLEATRNRKKGDKRAATKTDVKNTYNSYIQPLVGISTELSYGESLDTTSNITTSGDFLYGTLESSITLNDESNINFINYERIINSPHLTHIEIGDINTHSAHYLTENLRGKGISLSKKNTDGETYFNNQVIQGTFKPNYSVQLLQDGLLIDETTTDNNGNYIFDENPLFIGNNHYELQFIGEFGDTYTKHETYQVFNTFSKEGEFNYNIYFVDDGDFVAGNDNKQTQKAFNIESTYGITNTISYTSGLLYQQNEDNIYITNTLAANIGTTTNSIETLNNGDDWNIYFRSQGRLLDINYNITTSTSSSDFHFLNEQQNAKTSVNLNKKIETSLVDNLFIFGNYRNMENINASSYKLGTSFRLKKHIFRISAINENNKLGHQISYASNFKGFRTRYTLSTSQSYHEHELELNKRIYNTTVGLRYKWNNLTKKGSISLNANKRTDNFTITGYATSNNSNLEAGLSLTTYLWPSPSRKINTTSNSLRNTGLFKIHAFIDENYNDIYDTTDTPVANIQFEGNHSWKDIKTDASGKATLPGVQHMIPTRVTVDIESIEDFTLKAPATIYAQTHNGGNTFIPIPLKRKKFVEFILHDETTGNPIRNKRFTLTSDSQSFKGFTDNEGYYANEEIFPGFFEIQLKNSTQVGHFNIPPTQSVEDYYFEKITLKNKKREPKAPK